MGFSLSRHFMVPVVLGLLFAAILSAVTLATAIVNHDTPLGLASVIAIVIAALGIVSLVTGPSTMRDRATEDTLTLADDVMGAHSVFLADVASYSVELLIGGIAQ